MTKFYKLKFLDIERDLPILKTPSGIAIAGFNPVGDMEVLDKSAMHIAKLLKQDNVKADILLTTELKGLPIAQAVAGILKCNYVCLRKQAKCYMLNPVMTDGESITSGKSTYYISEPELSSLKNKNIVFVDDVFSTGATFDSMIKFAKDQKLAIVACAAILREGKFENGQQIEKFVYKDKPIYCCGALPLPEEKDL